MKEETYKLNIATHIIGILTIFGSILLLIAYITRWQVDEPGEINYLVGLLVFFSSSAILFGYAAIVFKLTISDENINVRNPFKKNVTFNICDIEYINISIRRGLVTIISNDGKKIKLAGNIKKIDDIINELIKQVGKEKLIFNSK